MFHLPWRSSLGALEREVMDVLWGAGGLSVRDVQSRLQRRAAYTTVMTTLDRLFKKGLAARTREGRAFLYTAAHTRNDLDRALLSNLVDAVDARDEALLDDLERMVREKRRRLREKSGIA